MLWRILLATLLVQAVWFIITFVPPQEERRRLVLACLWLSSAAVALTAGTILMAPLTVLQILVFLWLYLDDRDHTPSLGWISLLWMASLFSAYQIILFLPVVAVIFLRMKRSLPLRLFCLGAPVLLLVLYTGTNPLVISSMVTASEQNATGSTILQSLRGVLWLWGVGGSVVLSVLGTVEMVRSHRWALVLSLLLVCAFIFLTFRPYYALLFTPLFIAGVAASPSRVSRSPWAAALTFLVLLVLLYFFPPDLHASPARATMLALAAKEIDEGTVLIAGSFGHEWQYESSLTVDRFVPIPRQIDSARVVVCLNACPEMQNRGKMWYRFEGAPVETWVRKVTREEWELTSSSSTPQSTSGTTLRTAEPPLESSSSARSQASSAPS
jgi:MFS family permease